MKVDDILEAKGREVSTTTPETTVLRVVEWMRSLRIGALVVSRDGIHLEGIVSETDVISALARYGADALDLQAHNIMSAAVRTCSPDDRVRDVMGAMTMSRVRHVPVLDHGRLCGIVSIGDVVKNSLEDADLEIRVLRDAYLGHR